MRPLSLLVATLLVLPVTAATSQTSLEDARAFVALRATPVGALVPMPGPALVGRQLGGAQLGIRYGFNREEVIGGSVSTQAIAASAIFPLGLTGNWSLHAGIVDADCLNCSPELMLGLGGEMRAFEVADFLIPGSTLNLGVSGDFGYGRLKPSGVNAYSLGIGAPIALSMSGGAASGMRIVPYLTPALGIGKLSSDCGGSESCDGTRFILGGGIGFWNPVSSISASVGVNHVFFPDQQPVFGVNVVLGGR
jgi:hypothetical protein